MFVLQICILTSPGGLVENVGWGSLDFHFPYLIDLVENLRFATPDVNFSW